MRSRDLAVLSLLLVAVTGLMVACQPASSSGPADAAAPDQALHDGQELGPILDTATDVDSDLSAQDLRQAEVLPYLLDAPWTDLQEMDAAPPDTLDAGTVCDCAAPLLALTVNRIPAAMNGSETYINNSGLEEGFTLTLPTYDFTIDVTIDAPCGVLPDAIKASYWTGDTPSVPLVLDFVGSGAEFFAHLSPQDALPEVPLLHLAATVTDLCGQESLADSLTVTTKVRTPGLHPFDIEDWWLMVHHRDFYTIGLIEQPDGTSVVVSQPEANGIDDFLEDLWLAGIGSAAPTAEFAAMDCGVPGGGNGCLAWELLERIRAKAYAPLGCQDNLDNSPECIPLRFAIEDEADAPTPDLFAYETLQGGEENRAFSMIGFGGGDLNESWVGLSESLDFTNSHNENNAKFGYGCFTTSLMRFFYQLIAQDPTLYALAEVALAPILPSMGGVPIGEMEGDQRVADFTLPASELVGVEKSRRLTLDTTIDVLATGLAALMVHEIGHSVGLVPLGPPPKGLFGGAKMASFVTNPAGSTGAHIDTEGPNLMQSGPGSGNMNSLDVNMLLTPFFFNPLNRAYLQGRVLVIQ